MSNLFEKKTFKMHSGDIGHWKIECDALTDEDLDTLAYIIASKLLFKKIIGVPTGGLRIAKALEKYKSDKGWCLIVDDVLTTGQSMEQAKSQCVDEYILGVVLFARDKYPGWIVPVFNMSNFFSSRGGYVRR